MTAGNGAGKSVKFILDGKEVEALEGETIWQVAKRLGTDIPHLCYSPEPGYRADGNCRACMVEIEGERVLAASCIRTPAAGMKVKANSDRAKTARQMVFELLIADQPDRKTQAHDPDSKFWNWAERMGIGTSRFPTHGKPAPTAAIRRWRSISTPAFSAIFVCAPAAKCRSTTSSAWLSAVTARKSCSTSTTRWAIRLALPVANACRPARPAR